MLLTAVIINCFYNYNYKIIIWWPFKTISFGWIFKETFIFNSNILSQFLKICVTTLKKFTRRKTKYSSDNKILFMNKEWTCLRGGGGGGGGGVLTWRIVWPQQNGLLITMELLCISSQENKRLLFQSKWKKSEQIKILRTWSEHYFLTN